jgi:hypothetical protein
MMLNLFLIELAINFTEEEHQLELTVMISTVLTTFSIIFEFFISINEHFYQLYYLDLTIGVIIFLVYYPCIYCSKLGSIILVLPLRKPVKLHACVFLAFERIRLPCTGSNFAILIPKNGVFALNLVQMQSA